MNGTGTAVRPADAPVPATTRMRAARSVAALEGTGPLVGRGAPELVLRWMAILAGAVLVAKTSASAGPLIWGIPLLVLTCGRTVEVYTGRGRDGVRATVGLILEVVLAAAVVYRTGGWHSGWVMTLVGLAAICGYSLPARWTGQVASAAVIVMFLGHLARPDLARASLDLDALLLIASLSVSYAAWLVRFGDRSRAELARTNERLMTTNDLLVMLERILTPGEDATDPQLAARAVARLARELVQPDVVVVATPTGVGDAWRVLLAEGTSLGAMVEGLPALATVVADTAGGPGRPLRLEGPALLGPASASGVAVPLSVRGRLIGAVVLESEQAGRWSDRDLEIVAQMGHWAALIVDNACRFNALWIVGSAEERARVARNLHDNLGQSMAALGLEMDRLARGTDDAEQAAHIREMRATVTAMVAELRYNMRDLCCDVSETRTLGQALDQLVRGVESRSRTRITLDVQADERLPLAQEHQVLQMARILVGAAVESQAGSVELAWTSDRTGGCLEVGYDGAAVAPGGLYEKEAPIVMAIAEVRERCWAVGARVECDVRDGGGSRVRCRVGP